MTARAPCLGCPDRREACHDACARYRAFREARARTKAREAAAREADHVQFIETQRMKDKKDDTPKGFRRRKR